MKYIEILLNQLNLSRILAKAIYQLSEQYGLKRQPLMLISASL